MKRKLGLMVFLGTFLFFSSAYANSEGDFHGGHGYGMAGHKEGQCPVVGQLTKKAHFLLENKTELGLTDDQVKTIKALKLQVEKDGIRQNADRETFLLDLRSKLGEDKIDVEGTNVLIDKSFASMADSTKSDVAAYAKLKSTLTPEQVTKMKELLNSKKEMWENKRK